MLPFICFNTSASSPSAIILPPATRSAFQLSRSQIVSESQNKLQGVHKTNEMGNLPPWDTTLKLTAAFADAFHLDLKELLHVT